MKKLISLAALALALLPIVVMADGSEAGQKLTNSGNNAFTGFVTATNLNPVFSGFAPPTYMGAGGSGAYTLTIATNQSLQGLSGLATIYGFSINCLVYNPVLVGSPGYLYSADTNGVAGGTVTIHEYKPTGAAVTVGTVVLPTSPHGGPYVDYAVSTLSSPYVPTAGSIFDAYTTSYNATPTNEYGNCTVTAILQAPTPIGGGG